MICNLAALHASGPLKGASRSASPQTIIDKHSFALALEFGDNKKRLRSSLQKKLVPVNLSVCGPLHRKRTLSHI